MKTHHQNFPCNPMVAGCLFIGALSACQQAPQPARVDTAAVEQRIQRATAANDAARQSASDVGRDLQTTGTAIARAQTASQEADNKATVILKYLKENK